MGKVDQMKLIQKFIHSKALKSLRHFLKCDLDGCASLYLLLLV